MSREKLIISVDQGTTSTRCILFDLKGQIRFTSQTAFPQIVPEPGYMR